jgi:excisionase family DNA binding protein
MTAPYPPLPRAWFSEEEAAEYLGCSRRTLQAWRQSGQGPAWIKLNGTMVRYARNSLDAFIARGQAFAKAESCQ